MSELPRAPEPKFGQAEQLRAWLPQPWKDGDIRPPSQPIRSPRGPWSVNPPSAPAPVSGAVDAPTEFVDTDAARVRPFVVTGGRTRPLHDGMRIESLLLATPAAQSVPLRFEQRRIVELTQRAISLAEVAANLAIPIGVARILASDLHHNNLIRLLEPHELSVDVIERIRDLVRAL